MKINFRKVSNSDFTFLKALYRSTREEEIESTGWDEDQKNKFIEFQFNAQHAQYLYSFKGADFLIITLNGKDIGRLYVWRTESQIKIIDISLLKKYRGKAIGTRILTELIEESNKTGKKLNLHVDPQNPALKLYERLGFKKTEDKGVYFFMERMPEKSE